MSWHWNARIAWPPLRTSHEAPSHRPWAARSRVRGARFRRKARGFRTRSARIQTLSAPIQTRSAAIQTNSVRIQTRSAAIQTNSVRIQTRSAAIQTNSVRIQTRSAAGPTRSVRKTLVLVRIVFGSVGSLLVLPGKLSGLLRFLSGLVQKRLGILDRKHLPHGVCLDRDGNGLDLSGPSLASNRLRLDSCRRDLESRGPNLLRPRPGLSSSAHDRVFARCIFHPSVRSETARRPALPNIRTVTAKR